VRTKAKTTKFAVSGYSNAQLGPSEGNVSRDGRWAVVVATRAGDGRRVAFAVDIDAGQKSPDIDLVAAGVSDLDWASTSALGTYVVVHGTIDGKATTTKVFSRQGQVVTFWPEASRPTHYDLTIRPGGQRGGGRGGRRVAGHEDDPDAAAGQRARGRCWRARATTRTSRRATRSGRGGSTAASTTRARRSTARSTRRGWTAAGRRALRAPPLDGGRLPVAAARGAVAGRQAGDVPQQLGQHEQTAPSRATSSTPAPSAPDAAAERSQSNGPHRFLSYLSIPLIVDPS
jgi:hypothetical protein